MAMAMRGDRFAGALWGLFAGDAIAMPVHWYYDVRCVIAEHFPLCFTSIFTGQRLMDFVHIFA